LPTTQTAQSPHTAPSTFSRGNEGYKGL